MRHLTVRNVPSDLAEALNAEKNRLRLSLNQTIIELLRNSLGVGKKRSNGLAQLGGNWTADEHREFDEAVAHFGEVDEELWR